MIVVDSSVVLKWVLQEDGSDDALELVGRSLLAPDVVQAEVGAVLTRKVRRRELSPVDAAAKWTEALSYVVPLPSPAFAPRALELSLELHHAMSDCYFLAAAEEGALPLVTADRKFTDKLRGRSFAPLVILLGEEVPDA